MTDSKPHTLYEICLDICILQIVFSAFSFPSGKSGTCWSIYSSSPAARIFVVFLLLRKGIKIGRGASGCAAPIGPAT